MTTMVVVTIRWSSDTTKKGTITMMKWSIVGVCVFVGASILAGLGWLGTTSQWEARGKVAAEKVGDRIDLILGETKVREQEIDDGIAKLEQSKKVLRRGKVEAQVALEEIQGKQEYGETQIAKVDSHLRKIQTQLSLVSSSGEVAILGNTYSADQVKQAAKQLLNKRKNLDNTQDAYNRAAVMLEDSVAKLTARQRDVENKLSSLKAYREELRAKAKSLEIVKKSAATMGDASETYADQIADLEASMEELDRDIEVELRLEEAAFQENVDTSSANTVLQDLEFEDIPAQIEAVLNDTAEVDKNAA
jgi:chromosome segregation ATPase